MDLLLTLCGSIVLIFTIVLISRRKKSPSYPSGPIGLPWLGNILQIDPFTPHISITNLAKKYGDLYSISMLGMDIIVVSGSRFIKQVLRSPHLSGRPYLFRSMVLTDSRYNVGLMSPSTRWRQMKQCEVAALALQGEGLLKLERICTDILMDMTGEIQIHQGQPFQPYQLVRKSMVNILSSLMYGTKLEESELTELLDIENELTRAVAPTGNGVELDIIPWLRYVYSKNYDNLVALRNKMMTWFDKMIQKREAAMDLCDNQAQCAVDVMLSFARGQWHNHGQLSLSRDDVIMMNTDLIFAGTATTTVTLHVFLALMATRTDVQEKLHFEVTTILGGRNPSLADRKQIPYCNAVFHELLRYLSHAPIGLPHLAVEDTYIDQYLIPKNTQIWVNLWALHHEEKHWENPWLFNPDRFLDESGQLLPGKAGIWKNFVPFGLGKRACLGEALAINRLFLSMTTLVQRFKFSAAEGYPLPDVDPRNFELGVVLKPPDYFIVAKARHL